MTKEIVNKPKEIWHSVNGWKDGYQETCGTRKHEDAPGYQVFFPRVPFYAKRVGKKNENKSGHQPGHEIDHYCDHDPQCESESRSQPIGNLALGITRNREQENQIPGAK